MFEFHRRISSVYSKKTQKNTKINSQLIKVKRLKIKFVLSKKLLC